MRLTRSMVGMICPPCSEGTTSIPCARSMSGTSDAPITGAFSWSARSFSVSSSIAAVSIKYPAGSETVHCGVSVKNTNYLFLPVACRYKDSNSFIGEGEHFYFSDGDAAEACVRRHHRPIFPPHQHQQTRGFLDGCGSGSR